MVRQLVPRYGNPEEAQRFQGSDTFMAQHNHKMDVRKRNDSPKKSWSYIGEKSNVRNDAFQLQNARNQNLIKPKEPSRKEPGHLGVRPKVRTDAFLLSHASKVPKPQAENLAREVCNPL